MTTTLSGHPSGPQVATGLRAASATRSAPARGARREVGIVRTLLALSGILFCVYLVFSVDALVRYGVAMVPFVVMIGGLFYCALAYQVIRYGAALRGLEVPPAPATGLLLTPEAPAVTVLIPSYQESRRVLIETVLSAAIAPYGNKRIVVLLDDPADRPAPLAESLGAIADLRAWLAEADAIRAPALAGAPCPATLATAYEGLARWLERMAARVQAEGDPAFAHVDRFFVTRVLEPVARSHRACAAALRAAPPADLSAAVMALAATGTGEIACFRRKTFANLPHAANKATNLNAYLGLMGGRWRIETVQSDRLLRPAAPDEVADIEIPMTDYVMTLDADSVIMADYFLTLVGVLEADPRAAVAQTPYLTFPGGTAPVERIAGATTDIQYLIHQGSSHYGAAYWVGANAVIRRAALEDIRTRRIENSHPVDVFVQDKTVIEDTGSTIDLLDHGWHVHNHFSPLAYSATPADFGALAIQRKRWANGGLILFGDMLRSQWRQGRIWRRLPQLFVRAHYLLSPLVGNVGILVLMLLSTRHAHPVFWAALFMTPYFLLYMRDLQRMGYRWWDLFGVSALNLMLLPVNLAGVLASLWQMAGGRRLVFARTPKVASRTYVPPYAFVFNLAILGIMVAYVVQGLRLEQPLGTVIPLINTLLYSYGLIRFIGLGAGFADLWRGLRATAARLWERLPQPSGFRTVPGAVMPLSLTSPLSPASEEDR